MGECGATFVAAPCLHRLSLPLSHTHTPSSLHFCHHHMTSFFACLLLFYIFLFKWFCNCEEKDDVYSFFFSF